ncbi:Protein transport protein BET1 [Hanseniaspora osmophila]|uniref:Protein transport protein BET1 n=1 Tax=Hanseniaspora osmophila TaxID=56408 RepID=A0A1E5R4V8_9ASCO|nr:Protein transport protein BET1 [Hanseniaspora osmophila]
MSQRLYNNSSSSSSSSSSSNLKNAGNNSKGLDYNGSMLSQLESQSEEQMSIMGTKVKQLKNLTTKMGDEIRSSNSTVSQLGETFEGTSLKLKKTFNKMMIMASKSRIPLRTWFLIFVVIGFLFFYVWVT